MLILILIFIYMFGMLVIGYFVYKWMFNLIDYMFGGCILGFVVIVLSVGVFDMSGWFLMGLFGVMFSVGLSSSWIVIGLILGVYVNWFYVVFCLCIYLEIVNNFIIILEFLEYCFYDKFYMLCLVFGFVIMIFFIFYVVLGLVLGVVLFENLFGMNYYVGLFIVVGVVVVYILFGGFLVVSWIDFV